MKTSLSPNLAAIAQHTTTGTYRVGGEITVKITPTVISFEGEGWQFSQVCRQPLQNPQPVGMGRFKAATKGLVQYWFDLMIQRHEDAKSSGQKSSFDVPICPLWTNAHAELLKWFKNQTWEKLP